MEAQASAQSDEELWRWAAERPQQWKHWLARVRWRMLQEAALLHQQRLWGRLWRMGAGDGSTQQNSQPSQQPPPRSCQNYGHRA